MNNLPLLVEQFLDKYGLLNYEKPFLVAFSGGFDSMCLLHILSKISDNKIIAIHLNHNWRGEESLAEEVNCKNFCKSLNIEFYAETLSEDIPKTETAARDARYAFFSKCAEMFCSDVVFMAHNYNDNAETVLYRIVKGTGIDGLSGISEVRKPFYRPLLKAERGDIEAYCNMNNLKPNMDSSNFNTKYNRNFIRYKMLPEMQKINPKVVNVINSLSEQAAEDSALINEITLAIGNNTQKFIASSGSIQNRIVKQLLVSVGVDYDRKKLELITGFIKDNCNSKSGKVMSIAKDMQLYVNSDEFKIINNILPNEDKVSVNINQLGSYDFGDGVLTISECIKCPEKYPADSDKKIYVQLKDVDFTLRTRENGDYIAPLGLKGVQKLKKYLNEKKIPQYQKNDIPLLCTGSEVLWVVGYGISDKIKVRDKVTHVISFEDRRENNEQD